MLATFSREQLPRAVSAFGPVMGGSAVLAPIVAGFIIDADTGGLSWRPMFLINIILGAIGFAAAVKLLPHDDAPSKVPIVAACPLQPGARHRHGRVLRQHL